MPVVYQADIVYMGFSRYHTVAVTGNGTYLVWGWNTLGRFGVSSTTQYSVSYPQQSTSIVNQKRIVDISAGWHSTVAVASDGSVYNVGSNDKTGALGRTETNLLSRFALTDPTLSIPFSVVKAKSGYGRTVVLGALAPNNIMGWGQNEVFGTLGSGQIATNEFVPVSLSTGAISGLSVSDVALGGLFTLVLSNGAIYGAGYGYENALATGSNSVYSTYIQRQVVKLDLVVRL
jgi:alpha-tubulin suppressor-like RCC1 family protein